MLLLFVWVTVVYKGVCSFEDLMQNPKICQSYWPQWGLKIFHTLKKQKTPYLYSHCFLLISVFIIILSYSPWKEQLKGRKKLSLKLSVAFWTIAWSAAILRQTGEQRRTKWSKVWPLIMSTAGQTNYCRSFTWKKRVGPTNLKRDINIDAADWIWKTSGRGLVTCRVTLWLKSFSNHGQIHNSRQETIRIASNRISKKSAGKRLSTIHGRFRFHFWFVKKFHASKMFWVNRNVKRCKTITIPKLTQLETAFLSNEQAKALAFT